MKVLKVNCPKCKSQFNYYDSQYRPFCGQRCKEVDLGHWVTESYRVPSQEKLSDADLEKVLENINNENGELES